MKKPAETKEDGELVKLALAGEAQADAAFRALYERYKDEVYGFLVRLLGDETLAEDVLQEAFLRVYRALEGYDPERSFRAWLYQIARNAALDALRLRRKGERLASKSAQALGSPEEPVVPEVARREAVERTRGALEALPAETRAMLIQRHGLGMKVAELAESWAVTERTVTNRLRSAAALLAQALSSPRSPEGGKS